MKLQKGNVFTSVSRILSTGRRCTPPRQTLPLGRHLPRQTPTPPPGRRLLQWTVCILLECILVTTCKRNCGKVMFSQASVYIGGGSARWYTSYWNAFLLTSTMKLRRLCFYRHLSVHGGGVPAPGEGGVCCGRYASYWNAFSFSPVLKPLEIQRLQTFQYIIVEDL